MCGIFGIVTRADSTFERAHIASLIESLFLLSESRGKDAAGMVLVDDDELTVYKRPLRARTMVRSPEFSRTLHTYHRHAVANPGHTLAALGHARMVTNGSEEAHDNNQPVIKHGMVVLHNGIVVNDEKLWTSLNGANRKYEVDTEVILEIVAQALENGKTLIEAVNQAYQQIQGANSTALLASQKLGIVLSSSNGSLYFTRNQPGTALLFASEEYIVKETLHHPSLHPLFADCDICHVAPGEGYAFSFADLAPVFFQLNSPDTINYRLPSLDSPRTITDLKPDEKQSSHQLKSPPLTASHLRAQEQFMQHIYTEVNGLKRCTNCLLPETFPYISFDKDGICNYCHTYQPIECLGEDRLEDLVSDYRRVDDRPDCLYPLSGGRDSSYGIHYIKKELGLNPVAYTYDWGMVTDLARRNISRMCGQLGIEHILISADIRKKRKNIRKNVLAWLKKPDLGTVPLFMAGDKQFFHYARLLQRQMKIDLTIFSQNELERTEFKSGFTGVPKGGQDDHYWGLSIFNQLKMIGYYGKAFLSNPAYINSSLSDTLFGYISYYIYPRDFILLYRYIPWQEQQIIDTLLGEYDWETAADTESIWRIGDGTAPFYNYIYYVMAGFTEHDTFRSNQIREGMLERDEALKLVERDNQPRYESIRWYCNTIGIDYRSALKVINEAPRLYAE